MKRRRITVTSAKGKGRWLQQWACDQVSKLLGISWGYEDDELIQPRIMGQKGVDVILKDEALENFPFSIECKSSEAWAIPAAIRQARRNQKKDTEWLLIMKRKEFQNPVVIVDANVFFKLMKLIPTIFIG